MKIDFLARMAAILITLSSNAAAGEEGRDPGSPAAAALDPKGWQGVPPRGWITLSDATIELIRDGLAEVRAKGLERDPVGSVVWSSARRERRHGETEWQELGAGFVLGFYDRAKVPPELLEEIHGLEVVFNIPEDRRAEFKGKVLDLEDGRLVLRAP